MNVLYNLIAPLISALIGGVVSLWIYREGEKRKIQEERKHKIKSNFQTEKYFFHNIDSITFFIDRQIEEVSKTSRNIKNWNVDNLGIPLMSELKLTELRELDFKTLYQIFVIEKEGELSNKAQAFINIKNCLHNIEDFSENQKVQNLRLFNEISKNINLWNKSIQRLMELYTSFIVKKPDSDDKLIKILDAYLIKKQKEIIESKKDQNIESLFNKLILPILNEINNFNSDIDERVELIYKEILNCKKTYFHIKSLRYQRRKDVLNAGRRLLQIKKLLRESCQEIQSFKPRIRF